MVFEGYKTEKKEKVGLQTTNLSNQVLENISVLDKILTYIELGIIQVLEIFGPMNTKQVRDQWIHYAVTEGEYLSALGKSSKKYANYEVSMKEANKEVTKKCEKILRERNVKIPSHQRFDNILKSLERIGIVARRYDPFKRGKWLWILNPKFAIARKKKPSTLIHRGFFPIF